jgi:hypothetical protein
VAGAVVCDGGLRAGVLAVRSLRKVGPCVTVDGECVRRRATFEARLPRSDDDIYTSLYTVGEVPRLLVIDAWTCCARTLDVPPDKLRPDDAFDGALKPVEEFGGVSDRRVDLVETVTARLQARRVAFDTDTFATVGAIVRALVRASPGAPRPPGGPPTN